MIASAIASSSSALFLKCQYSVGDCTPSRSASRRVDSPSIPTSSSNSSAARNTVSRVSRAPVSFISITDRETVEYCALYH